MFWYLNSAKTRAYDNQLAGYRMTCAQRKAGAGIIVHSDRGDQYTSRAWQDMLAQRGMVGSM
ncbi:MAG: hypothetical protein K8963_10085, partial [Proteobacteria bacterium]|nr:hypothetical protein [Pseudomonadota bacterium]